MFYLCGTTLIPAFNRHSILLYRANPARPNGKNRSVRGSEGIPFGSVYCLAPSGSSLKTDGKGLVLVLAKIIHL